ncbi:5-oxoprolinase subunit PxpB [Paenibacillus chitinolyticus]|uniref:5-oxoprolinase subunit PxpB n=1 Tax=Paenibacillus chitinolyticus TaxID=79263 RepID=UPI002DBDBB22|nr:5-oxoprolinase subunit PxpB [Paenibacillus chitinolyticus]MEC0249496.1 5-oxoprolinase subunit PxpB [Paenibacillus chitinolyticus]
MEPKCSSAIVFEPLGDQAVVLRLGESISEEVHRRVLEAAETISRSPFPGLVEIAPTYTTVTVWYSVVEAAVAAGRHFSPSELEETEAMLAGGEPVVYTWVRRHLERVLENGAAEHPVLPASPSREIFIPVCYGGSFGLDLEDAARTLGMSPEEVVRLHSGGVYRVYMIGFVPGFPYLGGLPSSLALARRSNPRVAIPAGSVGIGGSQTGIYPLPSPGGWHIIGRTPLDLLRTRHDPPVLLQAGDTVRFVPVDETDYERLCREETETAKEGNRR